MSDLQSGLKALDEAVIKAGNPGPPGSGVFLVLATAAEQFLGVPRMSFPADEAKSEPKDEPKSEPAKATSPPTPPPTGGARK